MLSISYHFLFPYYSLLELLSLFLLFLKNTWQRNCITESIQMVSIDTQTRIKNLNFMLLERKIPSAKTVAETHVRDLFTQRYTLMFTLDKKQKRIRRRRRRNVPGKFLKNYTWWKTNRQLGNFHRNEKGENLNITSPMGFGFVQFTRLFWKLRSF